LVVPWDSQSSNPRITSVRKVRSLMGAGLSTRGLMRRNLWVVPVVALALLAGGAYWVRSNVQEAIRKSVKDELTALLNADVKALTLWLQIQKWNAEYVTDLPDVRPEVLELLRMSEEDNASAAQLEASPQLKRLRAELEDPWFVDQGVAGFLVVDRNGRIVASRHPQLIGMQVSGGYEDFVERVMSGQQVVTAPFPSRVAIEDEFGGTSVDVPTMFAGAPFRDDQGKVIAVFGLRLRPEKEFTEILNTAKFGDSGETYAFSAAGKMLSKSRFEDQLKEIGVMPNTATARSVLAVDLKDPGVDLTQGQSGRLPLKDQKFTAVIADTLDKKSGELHANVNGYRDYRGVRNFAAARWLPEYDFGVITEVDEVDAFAPVFVVRKAFRILFGLLGLTAVTLLGFAVISRAYERKMRDAMIAAGKLGQYALEQKIGEGGMGSVYRGRHAMLRRPTAIKLLEPAKTTQVSVERFEREVQLTSQLSHPNTITIYDYGRTDEGIFYYAMEYLEGLSLQDLVERDGPQPDGRVVNILLQVCGSLAEAHAAGLIHRDIKPANIMLTRQGGVCDYVKLLDFGLVKALDAGKMRSLTAADAITGTPLYLPPESVQDPDRADARSDLYSLGAVGYFLLSGRPVFESGSIMDIIRQHVEAKALPPSKRANRDIAPELDALIMRCLSKNPAERPQSAVDFAHQLAACAPLHAWSALEAEDWWNKYRPSAPTTASHTVTREINLTNTLDAPQPRTKI